MDFILSAKPIGALHAIELGFLDKTVEGELRSAAVAYTLQLLAAGKGPRRTGEMHVDPATATEDVFQRMTALARKLYQNRKAGLLAVDAVRKALQSTFAAGLE